MVCVAPPAGVGAVEPVSLSFNGQDFTAQTVPFVYLANAPEVSRDRRSKHLRPYTRLPMRNSAPFPGYQCGIAPLFPVTYLE